MQDRVLYAIEKGDSKDTCCLALAQVRSGPPRRPMTSVAFGGGNWAAEGQKGDGDVRFTFYVSEPGKSFLPVTATDFHLSAVEKGIPDRESGEKPSTPGSEAGSE